MDIVIFYDNGQVENINDVISIIDLKKEKRSAWVFPNGCSPFEVKLEDVAQIKIYGGDY